MYRAARETGRQLAEVGIATITGGGPGIMEAANRGAAERGGVSIGLGIELPFEEGLNKWVNLGMSFRYFFVRKTMFVKIRREPSYFPAASERLTAFPVAYARADAQGHADARRARGQRVLAWALRLD